MKKKFRTMYNEVVRCLFPEEPIAPQFVDDQHLIARHNHIVMPKLVRSIKTDNTLRASQKEAKQYETEYAQLMNAFFGEGHWPASHDIAVREMTKTAAQRDLHDATDHPLSGYCDDPEDADITVAFAVPITREPNWTPKDVRRRICPICGAEKFPYERACNTCNRANGGVDGLRMPDVQTMPIDIVRFPYRS